MSLQDSEFIEVKSENVDLLIEFKQENDFKEENAADELLESGTNTWRWQSDEEEAKCGEIFVSNSGTFTLICANCKDCFENMQTFGSHIRNKHLNIDHTESNMELFPPNLDSNMELKASNGMCSSEETDFQTDPFENIRTFGFALTRTKHLSVDRTTNMKNMSTNLDINANPKTSDNTCSSERTNSPTDQKWFCPLCNLQYKSKSSLTRHNKRHKLLPIESKDDQNTNANEFQGSIVSTQHKTCHKISTSLESDAAELPADRKLFCEICDRQFKTKPRFQYHAIQHDTIPIALQQDPNYLKCKDCNLEFVDYLDWNQHKRTHKGGRPYACTHCKKTFIKRTDCQMHINSHTGEKPFKCPHCPKAFAHTNNLTWHIKGVHLQLKPFACELCDRRFTRHAELRGHMRQHTGEKPYQCESCGRSFMLAAQMNEHRKRHTNIRDVKCQICDKGFYSKKRLRRHMVKHSNERPHICSVCGHTFAARNALVTHQKLHLDVKEYVCNICGKAFAQAAGLYSHKKSHGIIVSSGHSIGILGQK